jgi:hypothetical protein
MNNRSPYPSPPRPYWKGHNREEDKKLAKELFYGTAIRNKKTGLDYWRYPPQNSQHEHQGVEALCRLLSNCQGLEPTILAALVCSLRSGSDFERRLIFKSRRKRGRPVGSLADFQIAVYVAVRRLNGLNTKLAVMDAKDEFGITQKTVFAAMKRAKTKKPWFKV